MNGYVELEDLDAIAEMEDIEMDESDEGAEDIDILERRRRARRFRQPPRTAPGGGLFRPRPGPASSQYVTQTQLQAALQRVGAQIKTNGDAIKTLNGRVATLSSDVTRQAADLKKEQATRRREVKQLRDLSAILPLINQPTTVTLTQDVRGSVASGSAFTTGDVQLKAGTKVMTDTGDTLSLLLPLMLFSGGGLGGGGGEGGLGGDSTPLLLAVALSRRP